MTLFRALDAARFFGVRAAFLLVGFLRPDFPLAKLLLAETLGAGGRYLEALDVYESIRPGVPAYWAARLSAAPCGGCYGRSSWPAPLRSSISVSSSFLINFGDLENLR